MRDAMSGTLTAMGTETSRDTLRGLDLTDTDAVGLNTVDFAGVVTIAVVAALVGAVRFVHLEMSPSSSSGEEVARRAAILAVLVYLARSGFREHGV